MTSSNEALSMMVGLTPMPTDDSADSTAEESMDVDFTGISSDINMPGPSRPDEMENLVFFGGDDLDQKEYEKQRKIAKTLEQLQFSNPGEANKMAPPRRGRPRKDAPKNKTSGVFHDKQGRLNIEGEAFALCDCLNAECPGCFSPCAQCKGRYCGPICQSNRSRYCLKVVTNGQEVVVNPLFSEPIHETQY